MRYLSRYSVKDFESTIIRFKTLIKEARESDNLQDLMAVERVLFLYLRAIDNDIKGHPMSTFSRKLVDHEHKKLYKYD